LNDSFTYYICNVNKFADEDERTRHKNFINSTLSIESYNINESIFCCKFGCMQRVRTDIHLMKPETTSPTVDTTHSVTFYSVDCILSYLHHLTRNYWTNNILIKSQNNANQENQCE
jgi:hypothetical protein